MTEYDAVVFDLDSTLCVHEMDDEEIHAAIFERVDVEEFFAPADVHALDPADLPSAETDREHWTNLYRAVADRVDGDPSHAEALAEATMAVVDPTDVTFREGAPRALEYARERSAVGLVTNGGEATQTAKLEALGIRDAFDAEVYCDPAAGIEPKPDPTPLSIALDELEVDPHRALKVGDALSLDVAGAHNAGMASAWVPTEVSSLEGTPDPQPDYRLDSMAELPEVL